MFKYMFMKFGDHKFVCKSDAGFFVSIVLLFVREQFWITIWNVTYFPEFTIEQRNPIVKVPTKLEDHPIIIKHEYVHYLQWQKYGVLFLFLYLFFPLPIFFAYYRFKFEREAYLVQLTHKVMTVDEVVNMLWMKYLFTWPPSLMRKWFLNQQES